MEKFKNSSFYQKYENTYVTDKILKEVYGCDIKRCHAVPGINSMSYSEIHNWNVTVIRNLLTDRPCEDDALIWKMLWSVYIDPDSAACRMRNEIRCTADGLISVKRIYRHVGLSKQFVEEYEIYRKTPLIFFPEEKNGINMSRAAVFGDRIDLTLYDIKKYFEIRNNGKKDQCRLQKAFERKNTRKWLESFGSFEELADWMEIRGVFTDENCQIYDLEKGSPYILEGDFKYLDDYSWEWSGQYYEHIKRVIEQGIRKNSSLEKM